MIRRAMANGTASARGPLECADQWWGYFVRHQ